MFKKIVILLMILCFLIVTLPAQRIKMQEKQPIVFVRPDIVVDKIKVSSQPSQKAGKVFLKIEYWLSNNSSKHTRCCPTEAGKKAWKDSPAMNLLFNISVYAGTNPKMRFSKIGTITTHLKPNESNYRCQHFAYFDSGKTVYVKVIADPENWINEKNEKNNVKKTAWPLRVRKVLKK